MRILMSLDEAAKNYAHRCAAANSAKVAFQKFVNDFKDEHHMWVVADEAYKEAGVWEEYRALREAVPEAERLAKAAESLLLSRAIMTLDSPTP